MNILVIGSGGREHAIVRKLKESPKVENIYCAPGNGGISRDAECCAVSAMDKEGMLSLVREKGIDFVFVAPDDPLAAGMVDYLESAGVPCFGPSAKAAQIESSKVFSKGLMKKYGIPTAEYEVFSNSAKALEYIKSRAKYPVVIKADGLALGKGVIIAQNETESAEALRSIMEDKAFGDSGNEVVVEEFLTGPEVSVLAFTDGTAMKPMVSSMDHKRAFDGDTGPNTGGMGTVSPNPYYTEAVAAECMEKIFLPTMHAMNAEGRKFKGCLYFGLMLTPDGPKVIEYNSRFGDPETQVVLPRLETDFAEIVTAVAEERLSQLEIKWSHKPCACVVIASGGYPASYPKGLEIHGLDENGQVGGAVVYHAGTKSENGKFLTNGGRVLGVTAKGDTLEDALKNAYAAVDKITFDGAMHRNDIGERAMKALVTPEQLWAKFCKSENVAPKTEYSAWQFGDDPDKLLALVLSGDKTATCSSFEPYEIEGESLPQAGEYSIVLNSVGAAKCVIRTTKVYTLPFSQVSAEHAFKEGEGDKSYAYWKKVHESFFSQELDGYGLKFSKDTPVVCEEFEVVYREDNI